MSIMHPDAAMLTRIETEPDGSLRVFLAGSPNNLHTHVAAENADQIHLGPGHTIAVVPRDALCTCAPTKETTT